MTGEVSMDSVGHERESVATLLTAWRRARSLPLLVGSTSSWSRKVHSHCRWSYSSLHMPSKRWLPLKAPRSNKPSISTRIGIIKGLKVAFQLRPAPLQAI